MQGLQIDAQFALVIQRVQLLLAHFNQRELILEQLLLLLAITLLLFYLQPLIIYLAPLVLKKSFDSLLLCQVPQVKLATQPLQLRRFPSQNRSLFLHRLPRLRYGCVLLIEVLFGSGLHRPHLGCIRAFQLGNRSLFSLEQPRHNLKHSKNKTKRQDFDFHHLQPHSLPVAPVHIRRAASAALQNALSGASWSLAT